MKRLKRLVELTKIGTVAALAAMGEELFSDDERRSYDEAIVDLLRKTWPKTAEILDEYRDEWKCQDCSQQDMPAYMLMDEVWDQVIRGDDELRRRNERVTMRRDQHPEDREIMLHHLEELRRKVETGEIVGMMAYAMTVDGSVFDRGVGLLGDRTYYVMLGISLEHVLKSLDESRQHDDGKPILNITPPDDEDRS